jgi:hypothetical protein
MMTIRHVSHCKWAKGVTLPLTFVFPCKKAGNERICSFIFLCEQGNDTETKGHAMPDGIKGACS